MIAITGASGYIGGMLCAALGARGIAVRRLTRRPDPARGDALFALDQPLETRALAGVDTLIHAAHDFRPTREDALRRLNVDGSRRLFEAARGAGVKRIVFISSIASYAQSRSAYGRVKWTLEQDVAALGGISLRPGLVYGRESGGLFQSLDRVIRIAPFLPDLSARAGIYAVHRADLLRVIEAVLARASERPPALLPIAHPERLTMRRATEVIAEAAGRRARFVPVPPAVALAGLRAIEATGAHLPFRSDSLVSMLHANPAPGLSAEVLGVTLRPFTTRTLRE
jgi:nucleoside-diphosphate-sugar epimerase